MKSVEFWQAHWQSNVLAWSSYLFSCIIHLRYNKITIAFSEKNTKKAMIYNKTDIM